MIVYSLAILAMGFAMADSASDEAMKKELAKLQGTWNIVAVEENGQQLPEEKIKEAAGTVTIKGDKHTLKYGKASQGTVTIKIDPTAKPKHYDLMIPANAPNSADAGKTQHGIYELDGDTFKLCINKAGGDYPTEFSGKAGSGWVLVTMKKAKADR